MGEPTEKPPQEIESEDEEDQTFETLGLDGRLMRALNKKKIHKPTPIQLVAIPLTFKVRHLLQKLFASESKKKLAPSAIVLVPTRELSQQVYSEVSSSIEFCRAPLKVVQLTSSMPALDWRTALAALPEILVITPACIKKCLSDGVLQPASIDDSLEILVLDEADLLLSYGYEADIKAFTPDIPKHCQFLLMLATAKFVIYRIIAPVLFSEFRKLRVDVKDDVFGVIVYL